jgi:hypothetical protein
MTLLLFESLLSGRALGGYLVNHGYGLRRLLLLCHGAFVQTLLKVCNARFEFFDATTLAVHRLE